MSTKYFHCKYHLKLKVEKYKIAKKMEGVKSKIKSLK